MKKFKHKDIMLETVHGTYLTVDEEGNLSHVRKFVMDKSTQVFGVIHLEKSVIALRTTFGKFLSIRPELTGDLVGDWKYCDQSTKWTVHLVKKMPHVHTKNKIKADGYVSFALQ